MISKKIPDLSGEYEWQQRETEAPLARWACYSTRMDAEKSHTSVLVVDPEPLVGEGLIPILEVIPRFQVVGPVTSVAEALQVMKTQSIDILLVDITIGFEALLVLRVEHPDVPVLVVTMYGETLYAERLLRAGARGYIGKNISNDDLYAAILKASRGEYLPIQQFSPVSVQSNVSLLKPLSARESEVLRLIGEGYTTRKIAEALGVSVKTVETHRVNIKAKAGVEGTGEMVRFAIAYFAEKPQ
jgi:DNA-binding NarL/FixJ family response regulator